VSCSSEETTPPENTAFFHGDISREQAEARLAAEPNRFLLVQPAGSIHFYDLYMTDGEGSCTMQRLARSTPTSQFSIGGIATTAMNLADALTYLAERQAGWATPIGTGVPGLKVGLCVEIAAFLACESLRMAVCLPGSPEGVRV